MKRILILFIMINVITTSFGCWNRRELNELAIVLAMGIDRAKEDNKIQLAVQILKPGEARSSAASGKQGGTSQKGVWVLTSTGYTVLDAFRNATMQSDRKLYISQNKVIVIGEEMARAGIAPLVDLLDRDPEPRRLSWFLIAEGNAKDIIEAEYEQEKIPAKGIESLVNASDATSMAVKVRFHEFLKMLASSATDPVAGRIEIIEEQTLKKETQEASTSVEGKEGSPKKKVRLTGAAVFRGDKLVGWLNRPETRGLNWILGKVKSGIIVVKSPKDETQNVGLEIIRASSKIIPDIKNGSITITIEIKEEGNIEEQLSEVDLTKPEDLKSLERRKATVIKNETKAVIKKAQQWGVDIFGFGKAVQRGFPEEWKSLEGVWRDVFRDIEVIVNVTTKVRKAGMISTPVRLNKATGR